MITIPENSIELNTIDNKKIVINYKAICTAYDSGLIQSKMVECQKPDSGQTFLDVWSYKLKLFITGWSLEQKFDFDEFKQMVLNKEFLKLNKVISKIIDDSEEEEEKEEGKKTS